MARPRSRCSRLAPIDRHHVPRLRDGAAELRPIVHHALALLHKVTAPVGRFYFVADGMCQRHLGIMAWCSAFMFRAYPRDICLW